MKILLSISAILIFLFSPAQSEENKVPESIKSEIKLKKVKYHGLEYRYKVRYPKNYSKHKVTKYF